MKISLSSKNILKALIVSFILYQTYIQNKVILIPGLIPVLAGITGGMLLICMFGRNKEKQTSTPKETRFFIVYLVVMAVIGLLTSPSVSEHISRCIEVLAYTIIMYAFIRVCQMERDTRFVIRTMLFNAIILALSFLRNPVLLPSGRYSLTLDVNPNALGMSMVVGIWCVVCLFKQKRINKLVALLLVSIFTYCIIRTASLKCLAAVIVFMACEYVFSVRNYIRLKFGRGVRVLLDLLILMLTCLTIFVSFAGGTTTLNALLGGRMNDLVNGTASKERIRLYSAGIELFKRNWLFGLGFDGFKYFNGTYSHSTVVEVFVSGGITGGIIYFAGYISIIVKYIRTFFYTKNKAANGINMIGEAISGMAILTALLLVIIHPYEMISYICFALSTSLAAVEGKSLEEDKKCRN